MLHVGVYCLDMLKNTTAKGTSEMTDNGRDKEATRQEMEAHGYTIEQEVTYSGDDWSRFALVISIDAGEDDGSRLYFVATNNGADADTYQWSEKYASFEIEEATSEANRMMGR